VPVPVSPQPEGGLQGSIPASMRGGRLPCSGRPSTSASAKGGPEALSTGRSRLSTGRLSEGSDPLPGLDQLSVPSPKAGAAGEGEGARAQHVKRLPLERIQGANSRPYTAGLAEGGRRCVGVSRGVALRGIRRLSRGVGVVPRTIMLHAGRSIGARCMTYGAVP
jgi:hypothetical protein